MVLLMLSWTLAGSAQEPTSPAVPGERGPEPLRLVQVGSTSGLDPHLMDTLAGNTVLSNIFEGLVDVDAEGQLQPALAVSWQQQEDARRWTFTLRSDVPFHDGRALTAEHVVASLERARNHARSQVTSYVAAIESARAVEETIVEIVTRHPTPTLLRNLTNIRIVPKDSPEEIKHPVGTGPYRLADYLPGHGVGLRGFEAYWQGPPTESRVNFFFIAEPAERVAWLLGGRADLIYKPEVENLDAIDRAADVEVRSQRSQEVFYLHLDANHPPFDDKRVRCAVDRAIDRRLLADRVLGGRGEPAGQMVGAGSFGFSPRIEAATRDLEAAHQLLEQAGQGDGVTLILYHPLAASNVAVELRDQLKAAKVKVALKGLVWHEFIELIQSTRLPAYLAGWSESTFDAASAFESLVHTKDPERGFGDMNFTAYSRPALDRRIERAARQMDPQRRRELLEKISEDVREDCAFLPLVWPLELYGVAVDLEWTPRLDGMLRAVDMRRRSR